MLKTIFTRRNDQFIKRWPKSPKVVFFAAPNSFQNELINRFAIDLGLPVVSMNNLMSNIQQLAGRDEEFNHPFFLRVKEILDAGDHDQLLKDRVALKLLRLNNETKDGFVLTDFPREIKEAEMLEEFRGGMNSFVHMSLPDDIMVSIEETKISCQDCNREYYPERIVSN